MSLSRDSRAEQKLKAVRMAQMRLKQRLEMIDWREDELIPEIEALKAGRPVLGLTDGTAFDIVIESTHENHRQSPAEKPARRAARPTKRR